MEVIEPTRRTLNAVVQGAIHDSYDKQLVLTYPCHVSGCFRRTTLDGFVHRVKIYHPNIMTWDGLVHVPLPEINGVIFEALLNHRYESASELNFSMQLDFMTEARILHLLGPTEHDNSKFYRVIQVKIDDTFQYGLTCMRRRHISKACLEEFEMRTGIFSDPLSVLIMDSRIGQWFVSIRGLPRPMAQISCLVKAPGYSTSRLKLATIRAIDEIEDVMRISLTISSEDGDTHLRGSLKYGHQDGVFWTDAHDYDVGLNDAETRWPTGPPVINLMGYIKELARRN